MPMLYSFRTSHSVVRRPYSAATIAAFNAILADSDCAMLAATRSMPERYAPAAPYLRRAGDYYALPVSPIVPRDGARNRALPPRV